MTNTIPINDLLGDGGLTNVAVLSTDSNNNTVLVGADGIQLAVADYTAVTFANLPDPTTVQAGVPYYVSDVGIGGSTWHSNGTRWVPLTGSVVVATKSGNHTTPISTLTGVTSGTFTTDPIVFPAGMLVGGVSRIHVDALVNRLGTAGTSAARIAFGTDAVPAVSELIYTQAFSAINLQSLHISAKFYPNDGIVTTAYFCTPNTPVANGSVDKSSTKFNTALTQYLSFIISAANAADTHNLIAYTVTVYP